MAERLVRQLIDDLDGTEIRNGKGKRVVFAVDGATYQIDLSSRNIAKLNEALKPFIDAATEVRGQRRRRPASDPARASQPVKSRANSRKARRSGTGRNTTMAKEELAAIRDWARRNGYDVAGRGRIRSEIVEAFDAAQ
jgi:hypothetical protein